MRRCTSFSCNRHFFGTARSNLVMALAPDWNMLISKIPELSVDEPVSVDTVLFTDYELPEGDDMIRPVLIRERNGWCPYSERAWLAMEAKVST